MTTLSSEFRAWGFIAGGAALTFFLGNSMNMVDVSILGHLDSDARYPAANSTAFLQGAALANTWMSVIDVSIYAGIGQTVNVLVAQAFGAGNYRLMEVWLKLGVLSALVLSAVIGVIWAFAGDVAHALLGSSSCDALCADLGNTYARLSIVWLPAFAVYTILNNYLQAQNIVMPGLIANLIFVLFNFTSNYLLVFGPYEGQPGFGFVASPLSTAMSRWGLLVTIAFYILVFKPERRRSRQSLAAAAAAPGQRVSQQDGQGGVGDEDLTVVEKEESSRKSPSRTSVFLCTAWPLALGGFVEELQIQVVSFFAGRLGPSQVAAHNGLLQIFFMLTAVNYGVMKGTTVRVGNHLGNGDVHGAKLVVKIALGCSVVYSVIMALTFVLAREYLGRIFR